MTPEEHAKIAKKIIRARDYKWNNKILFAMAQRLVNTINLETEFEMSDKVLNAVRHLHIAQDIIEEIGATEATESES